MIEITSSQLAEYYESLVFLSFKGSKTFHIFWKIRKTPLFLPKKTRVLDFNDCYPNLLLYMCHGMFILL